MSAPSPDELRDGERPGLTEPANSRTATLESGPLHLQKVVESFMLSGHPDSESEGSMTVLTAGPHFEIEVSRRQLRPESSACPKGVLTPTVRRTAEADQKLDLVRTAFGAV
jgi:hypothetical protein